MDPSVKGPNPLWDPFGHTLTVKQPCFIVTTFEFYHMKSLNARKTSYIRNSQVIALAIYSYDAPKGISKDPTRIRFAYPLVTRYASNSLELVTRPSSSALLATVSELFPLYTVRVTYTRSVRSGSLSGSDEGSADEEGEGTADGEGDGSETSGEGAEVITG